ncbi:MAG: hypothetical protein E6Q88_08675 [Lysobacteraceae bacterium]|nr:MAG: hypothetical protein E6Q88_08675 [Xanthomonadaceae bacterium]
MAEAPTSPAAVTPAANTHRKWTVTLGALLATAAAGFGGGATGLAGTALALTAGVLAQALFALAVRSWRGGAFRLAEIGPLAVVWGSALLASTALIAWPLSALLQSHGLGTALALSAIIGGCLLGLWHTWPLWHRLERDGGDLRELWRMLADADTRAWTGLGAATLLALPLAGILSLAWPGLLSSALRGTMTGLCLLLWPLAHLLLQRLPAAPAMTSEALLRAAAEEEDAEAGSVDEIADGAPSVQQLAVALYDAARNGRVDRALALLDAGADAHAPPPPDARDQRTLPMLAAVLPDLRLLRALIAHGADLNATHAGMTPLIAATRDSWHGRPEAVMTLLTNGADPRIADGEGNTPLHHAARSSDPGVAALLRDAGADIDPLNHDFATPLAVACTVGNWRLARFLLERGAKPELPGAVPALHAAAGGDEDDPAGVQLLLKHRAKADARDPRGRSALHEAAFAGHPEIIGILLGAGADIHARDLEERTPFLEAARGGRLPALQALAVARPDPHALDAAGRNGLILACRADAPSPTLIRHLLELGIDPDHTDHDGKRAIDYAALAGRWALVAALDPDYLLPASVSDAGDEAPPTRSPLSLLRDALYADDRAQLARLQPLVSASELSSLLREGETPAKPEQIEWLLRNGANAELVDDSGDTPMFAWLAQGPSAAAAILCLLRHGVSPAGGGGLARFLAACVADDRAERSLERLTLELLDRGADPFASSTSGGPPLTLAVRLGWQQLIARLIAIGVALDARDQHGMTALHLAAALRREAIIKQLILHGASPNVRAADGQTPLGVALSSGRRDLADWLDWRGWPLPGRALRPADLPLAAIAGDADAVRRLIELGMPIDTVDAQGCSALLRAAGGGHRAVVDVLLSLGADPRLAARTGATPLSAAVSMRQLEIVERLLGAGATLEQRLPGDVTVLMLAAALGLPDAAARLLAAGANINAADAQGLTPLHCAALFGFTTRDRPRLLALFDALLLAGADPDALAAGGVTPLLMLLGARAEPGTACDEDVVLAGLRRLLDEGGSMQVRDPRGFGPLHLAALHGLLRVTQLLLREGADPGARDALNRTPREIAVMRGFVDVAAQFAPMPEGVSTARFLKNRE